MATLQFKGKNIIWNHHMSVPYHTLDLDEKLSYKQDKADGNLIIEGDNLSALKSLLPQYTGKVDCIYIDPPYNTGAEDWKYNDNVNSPLIRDWIGVEVAKDDLTRHDKWLTMMTPRLKLMRELLSEEGAIYVSIDDNEMNSLLLLMYEIFGEDNFVNTVCIQMSYLSGVKMAHKDKKLAKLKEYLVVFAKNKDRFELTPQYEEAEWEDVLDRYTSYVEKVSENPKEWKIWSLSEYVRENHIENIEKFRLENAENIFRTARNRSLDGKPKKEHFEFVKTATGKEKYIYNGEDVIFASEKMREINGKMVPTKALGDIWMDIAINNLHNEGDVEFRNGKKPLKLLNRVIQLNANKNSIILDAFAGSGTTAQAVLELNEEDEGNRKFILIQMPENSEKEPKKNIARDITRERIVKVIEKKLKNKDIGFEYRRVGQPIDAETILSGQLPTFKQLAKYVFYLATGQSPKDKDIDEKKYLAGKVDHTEVYLLYTPDMEELKKMAITFEWAKEISKGNENKKIVYAPACFMDDEYLEQFNIKFVSIPYNLFEREQ